MVAVALAAGAGAAECKPPLVVTPTVVGLNFCADPRWSAAVAERARKIREEVRAQRRAGKLIVYASTPISPRGGGDYMVMWAEVLGGEDGAGRDFAMIHFTGPGDMRAFFGCGREDVSGCVVRHPAAQAITDPARRQAFIRYYALRASSAYSTGSHDEWNIVVRINRKRGVGDQVAMFFDGRPASPAEMETEIAPGYEVR